MVIRKNFKSLTQELYTSGKTRMPLSCFDSIIKVIYEIACFWFQVFHDFFAQIVTNGGNRGHKKNKIEVKLKLHNFYPKYLIENILFEITLCSETFCPLNAYLSTSYYVFFYHSYLNKINTRIKTAKSCTQS